MKELDRSYEPITAADLKRFARLVGSGHRRRSESRPDLRGRLVAACLGQGGAAHYLDPSVGLKDVDLWLFYDTEGGKPVGAKVIVNLDLGSSKFGRRPADPARYVGRRVDVMARSLPARAGELGPRDAVLTWLAGPQASPAELRKKPVVLLWPAAVRGEVIWDPSGRA